MPAWNHGADLRSPSSDLGTTRLSNRSGRGGGVGVVPVETWVEVPQGTALLDSAEEHELTCDIRFDIVSGGSAEHDLRTNAHELDLLTLIKWRQVIDKSHHITPGMLYAKALTER